MKIIWDLSDLKHILSKSGVVLLPSDTIRGISCFADDIEAITQINTIKWRDESKTMIVLISENLYDIYIKNNLYKNKFEYPTTIIYNYDQLTSYGQKNISSKLIRDDNTIAIRKVNNKKMDEIISYLNKPIVSTSANISGQVHGKSISNIDINIIKQVDGVYKIKNRHPRKYPSHIAKIDDDWKVNYIRK